MAESVKKAETEEAEAQRFVVTGPRILLIDEPGPVTDEISILLTSYGYRLDLATTGQEAMQKAVQEPPALILLELSMEDIDGVALLARLRGQKALRDTPVVILTSRQSIDDVTKAIRLGAKSFMTKPFDPTSLLERVSKIVPMPRF
jgi:DNA-binding response OmpR family regulator